MDDLILLAWSNVTHCREDFDKHLVGYSTIQYVCEIQGAFFLAYNEEKYLWRDGNWFFPAFPGPRLRFQAWENGNWHHRHIAFKGPLLERWRAAGIWLETPQNAHDNCDFGARMDELQLQSARGDRLNHLRAINGLERLLLDLAAARQLQARDDWLESVLGKLDDQTLDFAVLAHEIGLSDTALRRKFKQKTGISMQDYRLNQKIARARVLLSDSALPLKEIAFQLGYRNEFFFARQFKQFVGVAPGVFRRSRLKN